MAWIKSYEVKSGARYRVFWKDPSGKQHARVFKRKSDARSFQWSLDHALDTGGYTHPRRGRITLDELWADFIEAPAGHEDRAQDDRCDQRLPHTVQHGLSS